LSSLRAAPPSAPNPLCPWLAPVALRALVVALIACAPGGCLSGRSGGRGSEDDASADEGGSGGGGVSGRGGASQGGRGGMAGGGTGGASGTGASSAGSGGAVLDGPGADRSVPPATEDGPPASPGGDAGPSSDPGPDQPPPCQRMVNVSSAAALAPALAAAMPGDCLLAADGAYGALTITAKGTAAAPIQLRAANLLKASAGD
jgi:hypothetical protein